MTYTGAMFFPHGTERYTSGDNKDGWCRCECGSIHWDVVAVIDQGGQIEAFDITIICAMCRKPHLFVPTKRSK